jgi:ADP-heptose:LPS heptosyltransferase
VQELQAHSYDAVIDLQGLTKSALIARLARLTDKGRRIAMANRTQGSAYEAPTRWVSDIAVPCAWHSHAVQRARHVCAQALGYAESTESRQTLFIAPQAHVAPHTVALVHGTSRLDKTWPLAHWITLALQLNARGFELAIPQSNDAEAQTAAAIAAAVPGAVVWPRGDVLSLTRSLAACKGVIGVDSGPSHIAVALGLPHVQIYNFDTAWRTGIGCGRIGGSIDYGIAGQSCKSCGDFPAIGAGVVGSYGSTGIGPEDMEDPGCRIGFQDIGVGLVSVGSGSSRRHRFVIGQPRVWGFQIAWTFRRLHRGPTREPIAGDVSLLRLEYGLEWTIGIIGPIRPIGPILKMGELPDSAVCLVDTSLNCRSPGFPYRFASP